MKTQRLLKLCSRFNATPSRVLAEIRFDGWENTGWNGRSATTPRARRGLKRFEKKIRGRFYEPLMRRFTGATVQALPLP